MLPLLLFIAVHLLAEQPDTVASQSIVVSYKVNSPTRPPTAPAEMFSKQFYHSQEYFLYIFISSWLFHFCAFSKQGIALHYSFLTMHVVSSSTWVRFLNMAVVAYLSTQGEEAGSIGTDFGSSEIKSLNP